MEILWRKGNTLPLLVGVQTCTLTMKINMEVLRKYELNLPQDPAILLWEYTPKTL